MAMSEGGFAFSNLGNSLKFLQAGSCAALSLSTYRYKIFSFQLIMAPSGAQSRHILY